MAAYEELDYTVTPLGELILRRREVISLGRAAVFEIKLGGEFLMSSLVHDAETALATCALSLLRHEPCDVLVGGLGLGYTAAAALESKRVGSVVVVEYLERVIEWHRRGLVPLGSTLAEDPRCHLVHGDFFAAVGSSGTGMDRSQLPDDPLRGESGPRRFHVILLDIDHSPQCVLHPAHAAFYTPEGLARLARHLHPGGVFALWSADPPEPALLGTLHSAFARADVHESRFHNPLLNVNDVNYIVTAQRAARHEEPAPTDPPPAAR